MRDYATLRESMRNFRKQSEAIQFGRGFRRLQFKVLFNQGVKVFAASVDHAVFLVMVQRHKVLDSQLPTVAVKKLQPLLKRRFKVV